MRQGQNKCTAILSKRSANLNMFNNVANSVINNNNSSYYHHISDSTSILIVDDEIDILTVIQQQLQDYGFDICCFTKPNIALEHYKASSNTHQIIISDLLMPNMNGFEFVKKAKEINSNVKVFLMTCFETDDLELSLLSSNSASSSLSPTSSTKPMIDEFIRKPFSIDKLIILIKKHVSNETKGMNVCQLSPTLPNSQKIKNGDCDRQFFC
jgi:DNA-binding NtrC family response regulator